MIKKDLIEKLKSHYITMIAEKNFDHFINPRIIKLEDGEAEVHWQAKPDHLNRFGAVHGGALAGLIDTVAAIASLTKMKRIVTIELNVSYIKAANISTHIIAKGKVIHAGRSLLRTSVELMNAEGDILTKGNLTFFVLGDLTL
ncbi:MAG: PaaI family thioesterase [Firmicutes bacterium]|nr:PaaI family thioesterase [Bacillota bacterium]